MEADIFMSAVVVPSSSKFVAMDDLRFRRIFYLGDEKEILVMKRKFSERAY